MYALLFVVVGMTIFLLGLRYAGNASDGRRRALGLVIMTAGAGLVATSQVFV